MRRNFRIYDFTETYEFNITRFYVSLETQKYNQVTEHFEIAFGSKLASLLNINPIIQSTRQDSYDEHYVRVFR